MEHNLKIFAFYDYPETEVMYTKHEYYNSFLLFLENEHNLKIFAFHDYHENEVIYAKYEAINIFTLEMCMCFIANRTKAIS